MSDTKAISPFFRHLLVSVALLWAVLLQGQVVLASGAVHTPDKEAKAIAAALPQASSLQQEEQQFAHEATAVSLLSFTMQQAVHLQPAYTFAPLTDEALPAFTAQTGCAGLMARLFPIIIQPNAP